MYQTAFFCRYMQFHLNLPLLTVSLQGKCEKASNFFLLQVQLIVFKGTEQTYFLSTP